jgi:glucose dehydrogenase
MEMEQFEIEFEIGTHSYACEGLAYYEDEADEEVGCFERVILRVFIDSCEVFVEETNSWVRTAVTDEIVDKVWVILEKNCSDW